MGLLITNKLLLLILFFSSKAAILIILLKATEGKSLKLLVPSSERVPISEANSFFIEKPLNERASIRSPGWKSGFIPPAALVIRILLHPSL